MWADGPECEDIGPRNVRSLPLSAQTMVYTIHEIPIFIAMGVVGKAVPTQRTSRPAHTGPLLSRQHQAPSSRNKACGGDWARGTPGLAQL